MIDLIKNCKYKINADGIPFLSTKRETFKGGGIPSMSVRMKPLPRGSEVVFVGDEELGSGPAFSYEGTVGKLGIGFESSLVLVRDPPRCISKKEKKCKSECSSLTKEKLVVKCKENGISSFEGKKKDWLLQECCLNPCLQKT